MRIRKLAPSQVRTIRRTYWDLPHRSLREIGEEYGVSAVMIWKIVNRISWKHLSEAA